MDRSELFRQRIPQEDIEILDVGVVTVRGLSRHEAIVMQAQKGVLAQEMVMLCFGMVEPMLTEDEVKRWQRCSPAGELEPVTKLISRLSGMGPDADKESYKSLRNGSDAGIRILSGTEIGAHCPGTPSLDVE
jgi:hypothetical protein